MFGSTPICRCLFGGSQRLKDFMIFVALRESCCHKLVAYEFEIFHKRTRHGFQNGSSPIRGDLARTSIRKLRDSLPSCKCWIFGEMCFQWGWTIFCLTNSNIWSNYSDLRRPHPKWWFSKGNPLISGKCRLVKYYSIWPEICLTKSCIRCWIFLKIKRNMKYVKTLKRISSSESLNLDPYGCRFFISHQD